MAGNESETISDTYTPFFTCLWSERNVCKETQPCWRPFQQLVCMNIVAIDEDSMSMQYSGGRDAILGVIHETNQDMH